ncbi:N-formylglutamate amidohydrolase [Rhizobium sp. C4]|uniref:N-formylglutamate amidohydrolase n=1 Tax=Rhizobium sp. C4 TaxID=1349800 RepID=UPI001E374425|nr:N-formylglutamate amidohydrolase [Rhizobium sp. C4]MCD2173059.1 N-formylglutamate amidohydrolase [Rhizobium sp. C4]
MRKWECVLSPDEGEPVGIELAGGRGPFVIVCEHASATLPRSMGDMGLSEEALRSHIAWDPGALAVARLLSQQFDSPLVFQKFSRLVYDCNRPPESSAAMPMKSEIYTVPANENVDGAERLARTRALYRPFHSAVSTLIDERTGAGLATSLITVHSFTPVYFGKPRAVEVGILHDADARFADDILSAAASGNRHDVRRNEPYGPADGVTHSLILHGISRGIPNVMIEVRNDLIADQTGQGVMAGYLSELIAAAIGQQDKNNKTFVNVRSHQN